MGAGALVVDGAQRALPQLKRSLVNDESIVPLPFRSELTRKSSPTTQNSLEKVADYAKSPLEKLRETGKVIRKSLKDQFRAKCSYFDDLMLQSA